MMLPIHVVIPVFNGWAQTRRCLDALRSCGYPSLRVLVVDHGSSDETPVVLPRDYPEVTRVVGDSSLWWSGATNLGIRTALDAGAKVVMLLNNDCYLQPGAIESMAGHLVSNPRAVIAPMQSDLDGKNIQSAGIRFCLLLGYPSLKDRSALPNKGLKRVPLIEGGRGALIPREVFDVVGLMDEVNLPHYAADHDFYLRCRKQNIALFIDTASVIRVDLTKTSIANQLEKLSFAGFIHTLKDRRSHRNLRDLMAFFKKHYPIPGLYPLGVALNLARYAAIYALRRSRYIMTNAFTRSVKD